MRLTSKGQVTIPIEIREQLGLLPDTEVEFSVVGDTVRIRKSARQRRGHAIVQHVRSTASAPRGLTTDQIMALTRGE